jgi:hypothetical protein
MYAAPRIPYLLKSFFLTAATAALSLSLISCAGTPRVASLMAERPKEQPFRSELKKEISSLNIAVALSAAELSDLANRSVGKELYRGSTKTQGVSAAVLKNGLITVSAADNSLYLSVPISMSLSYAMFQTPAFATTLKFKLIPKVTADWKVIVEAYYTGLSESMAQEVKIGPIAIKPRSIVDGITNPLQRSLSELISNKLNEKFALKSQVAKVWNAAHKPVLVDKGYNAWLRITPQELLLYPLYAQNNQLKLSVGLKSYTEVVVGPEPQARAAAPLPNLKLVTGMDNSFRIALNTELFYKDVLTIASPLLLNKELGTDGKSVILKDLDLYGNGDRLMVKVETAGSVEGVFYLTCKPVFDTRTNVFSVQDLEFEMQSRSLLLTSADWFLHGTIKKKIQEKLNMDLTQQLEKGRELAGKAIARVKLSDNLYLAGTVKSLKLNDVMVQRDKLAIQIYTEGETAILFH